MFLPTLEEMEMRFQLEHNLDYRGIPLVQCIQCKKSLEWGELYFEEKVVLTTKKIYCIDCLPRDASHQSFQIRERRTPMSFYCSHDRHGECSPRLKVELCCECKCHKEPIKKTMEDILARL